MFDDNRWSVRMCGVYRCTESHDGTTEDCGGREGDEKRREERDIHTSSVSITLSSHMIWPLVGV